MKRAEIVSAVAEAKELKKVDVQAMIGAIDEVVEVVARTLEVGDSAKLGKYITIEKVEVAEKSGQITQKDGTVLPYTTPAHVEVRVKRSSSLKNIEL